jgi:hypothetical protein
VLAAQHRKDVFVGKPVANTVADRKKILKLCGEADVVLLVGHDMGQGIERLKVSSTKAPDLIQAESNLSHRVIIFA